MLKMQCVVTWNKSTGKEITEKITLSSLSHHKLRFIQMKNTVVILNCSFVSIWMQSTHTICKKSSETPCFDLSIANLFVVLRRQNVFNNSNI